MSIDSNWISALANLVIAGTSLLAARAAFTSARSAESAAMEARAVARRQLYREAMTAAHSILSEVQRAEAIPARIARAYAELSAFSGGAQASFRAQAEDAKAKASHARSLARDAQVFVDKAESLNSSSADDLSTECGRLTGVLSEVHRIREELEGRLASVDAANERYRDAAIRQTRG